MNEIHIKFKPFVIVTMSIFVLLFYLVARSPDCPPLPTAEVFATEAFHQQQQQQQQVPPQPFTIYAITPTYARPVQKAELTRFVKVTILFRHPFSIYLARFTQSPSVKSKKKKFMLFCHLNDGLMWFSLFHSLGWLKLYCSCRMCIGLLLRMPTKTQI